MPIPLRRAGRVAARYSGLVPLFLISYAATPAAWPILLGAPLLAYLLLRLLTIHQVQASMMRMSRRMSRPMSRKTRLDPAPDAETPGPPPASALSFQELDETVDIALTPGQAAHWRQATETGQETWRLFRASLRAALGVLSGVALVLALLLLAGVARSDGWDDWLILAVWGAGLALAILVLYVATRLAFSSLQRVPPGLALGSYLLVAAIAAWLMGANPLRAPWAYLLAPAAGILVLLRGYWKLGRRLLERGDHPLLILRVFGADSQTHFVFGEIMRRWCFLGSHATIADPSYVRFQDSWALRANRRVLWLFAWSYVIGAVAAEFRVVHALVLSPSLWIAAALERFSLTGLYDLVVLVSGALLIVLSTALSWARVRRRFAHTLARLQGPADPRRAEIRGAAFPGQALYCHDDTWKVAVSSLLPSAQAVLMDVRGFTPERRGCEFELGLLLDRFPLDRVLLLLDEGPGKATLLAMIRDQWARLSADSPNRNVENPTLRTYAPGEEDPGDVMRILALLASALPDRREPLDGRAHGEANGEGNGEGQVLRGTAAPRPPKPGDGGRRGRPARALTPTMARLLILLILAGAGLFFYRRVRPIVEAYRAFPAAFTVKPAATLAESEPARGPQVLPAPYSVTAAVVTGEPEAGRAPEGDNAGLTVRVALQGGPVAGAYHVEEVSDLTALGGDGKLLELLGVTRASPEEGPARGTSDRQRFDVELRPASKLAWIRRLAGRATLQFVAPEQTIVVDDLAAWLPGPGWIRLSHPRLDPLAEIDLARFFPGGAIHVRVKGDLDQVQVYVLRPNRSEVASAIVAAKPGYLRREVPLEALQAGARLEVVLGAVRSQAVAFEVTDIPLAQP